MTPQKVERREKFTEGPWFVVHDSLCEEPWNFDVCAETPSADKTLVARVRIVPPHGDVEANANLKAITVAVKDNSFFGELVRLCGGQFEAAERQRELVQIA